MACMLPTAVCFMMLGLSFFGVSEAEQRNDLFSHSNQRPFVMTSVDTENSPVRQHIIVVMEEELLVVQSAFYLFGRHPSTSVLITFLNNTFEIVKGTPFFSAAEHELTLLGHGSGTSSTALFSRHTADQLVQLVWALNKRVVSGVLSSIEVVSCNLGKSLTFISRMIHGLRSLSIHSEVFFYNSLVSVSSTGDIMTETRGVWYSHDHMRRVTATLDITGTVVTTAELGCSGPESRSYEGHALFFHKLDWPSHPQMFVPKELRKKYGSIDCLEGLTWSLFFEESENRRAPNYSPVHDQRNLTAVWLTTLKEDARVFKHISSIQDLLVEIRYNAREETTSGTYYVLNECVYSVHWTNLSVSLVGKFIQADKKEERERFLQNFSDEAGSIQTLQQGLKASRFHEFCRQTFQFHHCSYNCELWGQYFMVAVFSASVVNFRIFSLFLMSVIGCEVGRFHGLDSSLCTSFMGDIHPMVSEQPWPTRQRRGFYGGTVPDYEQAPQEQQIWLDQVVSKENTLFVQSKQIMTVVQHDEKTELEIFGRVKVMNKYVFSSYLEYFRGTPEGKKLKTGCTFIGKESD